MEKSVKISVNAARIPSPRHFGQFDDLVSETGKPIYISEVQFKDETVKKREANDANASEDRIVVCRIENGCGQKINLTKSEVIDEMKRLGLPIVDAEGNLTDNYRLTVKGSVKTFSKLGEAAAPKVEIKKEKKAKVK